MTRKKVNSEKMIEAVEANKKGLKQKVLNLKKISYDDNSQDVSIMKNTPIIARITTADFSNNETFIIKKVADDIIIISNGHATMEIPTEQFQRCFRPAYCITAHSCQGDSYPSEFTIYEFERMDLTMRYVCLSRATKKKLINMI